LSDPGSHATGAATATPISTSDASVDAADAQGQAGGVHEESSPVFAQFVDPMDTED
jgi:hypothetical protein